MDYVSRRLQELSRRVTGLVMVKRFREISGINLAADQDEKCWACDKPFRGSPRHLVKVKNEDQQVFVGPNCYRKIKAAGKSGWLHTKSAGSKLVCR